MKLSNIIHKFSFKWLIVILVISVVWVNLNHERWKSRDVIQHDIVNYYAYLPALFIEHDLSLKFINESAHQQNHERYWPNKAPNGNNVIKMSMGMAISYLPFFGMAHAYAKLNGYSTAGFSEPYHFAILFSSLFYFIIGLWFLYRFLQMFFNEKAVLLVLFCLCFSTNMFFYLTLGAGLSHVVGFILFSMFLYYAVKWKQEPNYKYSIFLGLIFGMLILVRPVNGLVMLFFIPYVFFPLKELNIKKTGVMLMHGSIIILIGFLVLIPQMLYWKFITGQYLFNSYVGEGFYFKNPHVIQALFGFRKGWLIYTPVMGFAVLGFFFLKNSLKQFLVPVVVFFSLYIYVCFSWWCWWYGGSFGQRVLIDIYPVLAMPFAAFIFRMQNVKIVYARMFYGMIFLFTCLNLFQIMQAKYNILHYDSMTRANYVEIFLTTSKKPDREKYLKHPDYQKALRGEDEE